MAKNMIYADEPRLRRTLRVPAGTRPGTALIIGAAGPSVSLTGRGDVEWVETAVDGSTYPRKGGGVGLPPTHATLAFTGSFAFPVAGASVATVPGTQVYLTSAGALTLTEGTNKKFGVVDFFRGETAATDTVVKIGVFQ